MRIDVDYPRSDWEHLIDEWIFDEIDRALLKRRMLDGVTFERLGEEFHLSTQSVKRRVYKGMAKLAKHFKR